MEIFVSAVLGDFTSRSISFLMERYYRQPKGAEENLQRLHRMLLRIQTTVEEAEGRLITNQAMLQQLQMMRNEMYKGYYMLDTFKYQIIQEKAEDEVSGHSFVLSKFNPAKRLCFSTRIRNKILDGVETRELQKMIGSLESVIADTKEFVVFLSCYPPIRREPYGKYLLLENCMFGRQAEQERVINFLLETDPPGAKSLSILPIIGPARVGKSTLVEHVVHDERVHKYFSSIVSFTESDIKDGSPVPLRESGVIKHRNLAATGKSLVIIELVDDVDQETWRSILYNLRRVIALDGKIIITSRSKKTSNFGTTEALQLNFLHQEAYWYFFKTIAFGSTNPEEQPKLASIGMDIAEELNGSFIAANVIGGLLRANLRAQFWYEVSKYMKEFTNRHLLLFGGHPKDLMAKNRPVYLWRMTETHNIFLVYNSYQSCSSQHLLPKITAQDVHSGSVKPPQGKFEALAWRSNIPPYYNYFVSCVIKTPPPQMLAEKKRPQKRRWVNLM